MVGIKEICSLFAAAGLGAGSVVTVQQVAPAIQRPAAKPAAKARPAVQRTTAPRARARPASAPPVVTSAPITCIPGLDTAPTGLDLASPFTPDALPGSTLALPNTPGSLPGGGGFGYPGLPGDPGWFGGGNGGGGGGGTPGDETPSDKDISPVPEPGTWAMLVSGFGLLGLAMRRRKSLKAGPSTQQ